MEYISKQSLLADLNETTPHSYFAFETMVREYPTEDVAPVIHAHWMETFQAENGYYMGVCSHCSLPNIVSLYCGTCGAKMDADTLYVNVKAECNPYGKPTISFDDGCKVLDMIRRTPTADVAPVVHAEWKVNEHIELDFCSNCLEPVRRYVTAGQMDRSNYKGETFWNYCPHCGARMDGGRNDG